MLGNRLRVGLAGCGYWGRNLARNLHQMGHLHAVCDPSAKALKRPEVKAFMDYIVGNYEEIADASQIVAMSQEQAATAKADVGS